MAKPVEGVEAGVPKLKDGALVAGVEVPNENVGGAEVFALEAGVPNEKGVAAAGAGLSVKKYHFH